jgi:hypothetical protein
VVEREENAGAPARRTLNKLIASPFLKRDISLLSKESKNYFNYSKQFPFALFPN